MKLHRILSILLAAVLTMSYSFPALAVSENNLSSGGESLAEPTPISENQPETSGDDDSAAEILPKTQGDAGSESEPAAVSENHPADFSDADASQALSDMSAVSSGFLFPDEAPGFSAVLKRQFDGYVVSGCFTEFLPDTTFVQPQSSLDGETWQDCGVSWDLWFLEEEDPDYRHSLENQICLHETFEPLKSYLGGNLNRFYLRLRITRENGIAYETQAAVIERGELGSIPDDITCSANLASTLFFREVNSSGHPIYCGKYQLTVKESSSPEDITAFLPDTLPVDVSFHKGKQLFTDCTIDCPVTWKSLSFPALTAGESVTLRDAAEEILIPAGTPLPTPMGTFTLDEALSVEPGWWMTDEVVLVLNVIPDGKAPTGVLAINNNGLKMAFDLKPTGATSIRAYTLVEGDAEWSELSGPPFLDAVNAQPTTANSGYIDILSSSQEPYLSYLTALQAMENPKPFFVGLKIEGGVYDGCQLILACPDTYELPPDLFVGGSGGNEGNAGSDNKDDSTAEGQRPNLPKPGSDKTQTKEEQSDIPAAPVDNSENENSPSGELQQTGAVKPAVNSGPRSQTDLSKIPADIDTRQSADLSGIPTGAGAKRQTSSSEMQIYANAHPLATPEGSSQTDTPETQNDASGQLLANDIENHPTDAYLNGASEQREQMSPGVILLAAAVITGGIYLTINAAKIIFAKITGAKKTARL